MIEEDLYPKIFSVLYFFGIDLDFKIHHKNNYPKISDFQEIRIEKLIFLIY